MTMKPILLGACIALFPSLATAEGGWTGQVTAYVWATGLGGHITPRAGGPTLSFSEAFSDILEDLDGAFFLSAYARRDRFVLMGDISASTSSRDGVIPPGVPVVGGLPAEGKLRQRSMTLAAGYRVVANDGMTLDALAGMRAWRVESRISVAGGIVQASPRESFVDPIVALRANFALAPRWSAIVYADLGGFGAGSERTSQVFATANYQVNDKLYLSAGYRRLDVDYRSGGTRVDVTMAGPILGATLRF